MGAVGHRLSPRLLCHAMQALGVVAIGIGIFWMITGWPRAVQRPLVRRAEPAKQVVRAPPGLRSNGFQLGALVRNWAGAQRGAQRLMAVLNSLVVSGATLRG